jgi:hypothetical protein
MLVNKHPTVTTTTNNKYHNNNNNNNNQPHQLLLPPPSSTNNYHYHHTVALYTARVHLPHHGAEVGPGQARLHALNSRGKATLHFIGHCVSGYGIKVTMYVGECYCF